MREEGRNRFQLEVGGVAGGRGVRTWNQRGVGGKGMPARWEGKGRGDGRTGILSSNGVAANHRTWAQP